METEFKKLNTALRGIENRQKQMQEQLDSMNSYGFDINEYAYKVRLHIPPFIGLHLHRTIVHIVYM